MKILFFLIINFICFSFAIGQSKYQKKMYDDCFKRPETKLNYSSIDTFFVHSQYNDSNYLAIIFYNKGIKTDVIGYFTNWTIFTKVSFDAIGRIGFDIEYYYSGRIKRIYYSSKEFHKNESTVDFYESGKIMLESIYDTAYYSNELFHKEYYESGKLKAELYLIDTVGGTDWREFYESGKKEYEGYIRDYDSEYVGNWKKWYENGVLEREFCFDDATLPDGTWKWWDENGKLIKEYKYDHGISKNKKDYVENNIYAP